MIQKLQRKFILINMSLVSVVLLITFAMIISFNYHVISAEWNSTLHRTLNMENNPPEPPREQFDVGNMPRRPSEQPLSMVLWFSVNVDATGNVVDMQGNNVETTDAFLEDAVGKVLESGKKEGYLSEYNLRFMIRKTPTIEKIAFVDVSRQIQSIQKLAIILAVVGVVSLTAFFLISLFLARITIKPVKEAWDKQHQFVADASHELKTPLTVILANTGILLGKPDEKIKDEEKWIQYIKTEALRMKRLVEEMLFLAKTDVSASMGEQKELNLSDVVWSCLLPFESVAYEQGITLNNNITGDILMRANEGQIKQLVAILLDNACKYTERGGQVTVALSQKQDKVTLSVNNTGNPISADVLAHVFERFYRADESRVRTEGGYGLGLSIAKSIVEGHNGKINVVSNEENGTTFTVSMNTRLS